MKFFNFKWNFMNNFNDIVDKFLITEKKNLLIKLICFLDLEFITELKIKPKTNPFGKEQYQIEKFPSKIPKILGT